MCFPKLFGYYRVSESALVADYPLYPAGFCRRNHLFFRSLLGQEGHAALPLVEDIALHAYTS